ncbi:MAG TPA: hypothetical protein VMB25_07660 [Bryobacteraceae bacterium]|nr:hypothetical protein [Bryobacteraceae bacterium]
MRTLLFPFQLLLIGMGLSLLAMRSSGQSPDDSPSEIVTSIASTAGLLPNSGTCSITTKDEQDRALAAELTREGSLAVRQLEQVFDSLQAQGTESPYFQRADWFFLAYASMLGPSASQRLRAMIADPKPYHQAALDRALAVSLGATSYVSSVRKYEPGDHLCRGGEPRDALDELIAAFEQDDFSRLKPVLGPRAVAALIQLEGDRDWENFHRAVWRIPPKGQSAVGYLFEISGRWSEPEQVLEGPSRFARDYGDAPLLADDFNLGTEFKTASGDDCGTFTVSFHVVHLGYLGLHHLYQVNNENLGALVSLINSCFVQ